MPTKGIIDVYLSVPLNEIMVYPEFVLVGIRMECCIGTEQRQNFDSLSGCIYVS
jgi:hypothetical protein